ncbi:ankyrin repeat-containing domain protein [Dactylonectria macrodidyma]|uniref:Ankyrin repeat-containing domain protein n=1 Tax=Dactylonectria macrodidyma TaxID=307937 RepID=A0A9P9F646_9HYPO|nr:ankyrin repeat-containing domain protein [Dactylonectria macrodidyma]
MVSPTYCYNRIDLATDAIRLVRLSKGYIGDPICCEIFETFLHQVEGVPYEALSYAWGGTVRTSDIILNGCIAKVTANLYAALLQLRLEHQDRVLWIDAICIDQDNKKEQTHQVGQMKGIYANAEQVMIWLGPSNTKIDLLMDAINQVHSNARSAPRNWRLSDQRWQVAWPLIQHQLGGVFHTELDGRMGEALQELLQRPWFQRVWVIQEVASARAASVMCGSKVVSTQTFTQIPSLLDITPAEHTQAVLDVMPGYLRRSTWWSEGQNLATLVGKFRNSKASDSRDQIYALLGISSDAYDKNAFRPDYEKDEHEVMQDAVSFFLFGDQTNLEGQSLPWWTLSHLLKKWDTLSFDFLKWAVENKKQLATSMFLASKTIDINAELLTEAHGMYPRSDEIVKSFYARLAHKKGDPHRATLLAIAAAKGNKEMVAALLMHKGIDVNLGFPLARAAVAGYSPVVELLLECEDIDVNHGAPLAEALKANMDATARQLLRHGDIDLNLDNPLATAVQQGRNKFAKDLLMREDIDVERGAPLIQAVQAGQGDICSRLVERGANVEVRDGTGRTPLSLLAQQCWPYGIELLLDAGANIESRDRNGRTPLSWAAENSELSVVESFLDAGADIKSQDENGRTPLSWAAGGGQVHAVRLLLSKGADADCLDIDGRSPLDWAELGNQSDALKIDTPMYLSDEDEQWADQGD